MRAALVALIVLASIVLADVQHANAQGSAEGFSELDGWKVESQVFVDGGEPAANAWLGRHCPPVWSWITAYNDANPPPHEVDPTRYPVEFMFSAHENLPDQQIALRNWLEDNNAGISNAIAIFCTAVHRDGWKPAQGWLVDAVGGGNPRVTITTDDPIACAYGQVLMANSTYYHFDGSWTSYYGDVWDESYRNGEISVSGDVDFLCMDIILGGPGDIASIADAVPTSQVNHNPTIQGLTGLDTWLWYDFAIPGSSVLATHPASVFSRGETWALTANVWVDQVLWDIDCSAPCTYRGMLSGFDTSGYEYQVDLPDVFDLEASPAVLAPAPAYDGGAGTEADAAAVHVYRTKDDYTVSTATVWRGFYEFLGVIYPYDPVVVAQGVGYQVIEVRSQLVTPDP